MFKAIRYLMLASLLTAPVASPASQSAGGDYPALVTPSTNPAQLGPADEQSPPLVFDQLWKTNIALPGRGVLDGRSADVDGDGLAEVLITCGRRDEPSHVLLLEGLNGSELWRASYPGRSVMVTADLDSNGTDEVVVACGDALSVVSGRSGARVAETRLRAEVGSLIAGPVDGEVGDDIVCTTGEDSNDGLALLSGSDLRERWSVQARPDDGPFSTGFGDLSLVDLDGDGRGEVLASENGNVLVCVGADRAPFWRVVLGRKERLRPEGVVSARPVGLRLGGGTRDVAVGCFAGGLLTLDGATGETILKAQFGADAHRGALRSKRVPAFLREALASVGEPINELMTVELDGSPGPELVFGCCDGHLYAFDPETGSTLWKLSTRDNVYERCVVIPAPSGRAPVLLAWDSEAVYAVDGSDGSSVPGPPVSGGASRLLLCDLDGGQTLELVRISSRTRTVEAWRVILGTSERDPESGRQPADPEGSGSRDAGVTAEGYVPR